MPVLKRIFCLLIITCSLVTMVNAQVTTTVPAGCTAVSANTGVPVVFTQTTNITVTGNSIVKTSGSGSAWDAGGVSTQQVYANGFISAQAGETGTPKMFGLNLDPATNNDYTSIDYAIYLSWDNAGGGSRDLIVYESGTYRGTFGIYLTTDVLRVLVNTSGTTNTILYQKNGVTFYTSTVAVTSLPLYPDFSLYSSGCSINNINVLGSSSIGSGQNTHVVPASTSGCYGYGFQYTSNTNGFGISNAAFVGGVTSFTNVATMGYKWGQVTPVISTGTNKNASGKVTFNIAQTINPGCLSTGFVNPTLTLDIVSPAEAYWVNDGTNIYVPLQFGMVTFTSDVTLSDGFAVNGYLFRHLLNGCIGYTTYTSTTFGWKTLTPTALSPITGTTTICKGTTTQLSNASFPLATGGNTDVIAGGYHYHTFTSNGNLVFSRPGNVEVLVVGGGGSGGGSSGTSIAGGGGGGGGIIYSSSVAATGTVAIVVGAGGVGQTGFVAGQAGAQSKFGTVLTANGGGYGGTWTIAPTTGGSGGGAGETNGAPNYTGAAGTAGQGFAGGSDLGVYSSLTPSAGAGGGGAGGVGGNTDANNIYGGPGGRGFVSSISGSVVTYGGGGGGGGSTSAGAGGTGGGGAGRAVTTGAATAGTANTGGGGGGPLTNVNEAAQKGGNGGSGIVIVRYPAGTWTSSNTTVATVSSNGLVTAGTSTSAGGTTTITFAGTQPVTGCAPASVTTVVTVKGSPANVTTSWIGTGNTTTDNWYDNANWDFCVPDIATTAVINHPNANDPVISTAVAGYWGATAIAKNLIINVPGSGKLKINSSVTPLLKVNQ